MVRKTKQSDAQTQATQEQVQRKAKRPTGGVQAVRVTGQPVFVDINTLPLSVTIADEEVVVDIVKGSEAFTQGQLQLYAMQEILDEIRKTNQNLAEILGDEI